MAGAETCNTNLLTIDEAIAHAEEMVNDTPCGQQHRQLSYWLKELKNLKSIPAMNNAALREALEYVLQFDASEEAAMEDGLTDAERISEYANHIQECQRRARKALSEPVRNCDIVKSLNEYLSPKYMDSAMLEMIDEWRADEVGFYMKHMEAGDLLHALRWLFLNPSNLNGESEESKRE